MFRKTRLTALSLAAALMLSAVPAGRAARAYTWYAAAAARFTEMGLVSAGADMDEEISRARLVRILTEALGYVKSGEAVIPTDETEPFDDIPDYSPDYAAFAAARAAGLILGGDGNAAHPDSKITRSELAVIIARVAAPRGASAISEARGLEGQYADAGDIPDWAYPTVVLLTERGYFQGDADNRFRPSDNLTLAQALVLLDRVLGVVINDSVTISHASFPGNVTVTSGSLSLRDVTVGGSLIITKTADAPTLDDVSILGDFIQN
jgi:hypothetical protein